MNWEKVRNQYPHQWLLIEAIKARSEEGKRILEQISVIDTFPDSVAAMKSYTQLHHEAPERELYVFHTDRKELDVTERRWLGIRGSQGIIGMDFLLQVKAVIDLAQLEIYQATS